MQLAEYIGDSLIYKINGDEITRTFDDKTKSTEENIDAYMFLKQLGAQTGNAKYTDSASNIKPFIQRMLNKETGYFKAGSTDDRYVTDVQAMALMALGKNGLESMQINVDDFINTIIKNGLVKDAIYTNPSGKTVTVTGFGFTASDDKVSVEWTSQMIIGLLVIAKDYENDGDVQTAQKYRNMAKDYYTELGKMVDAQGNLPCATKYGPIVADWGTFTPKGTKALAATAYYQLATAGDNPFTNEVENLWK
jgi:hypothetical protein